MSEKLQQLLHDEAARIDVPPPPIEAILTDVRRRREHRWTRNLVAVAATAAVVAGSLIGANRLLADVGASSAGPPAAGSPTSSPTPAQGPVLVSGSGVEDQPFGAAEDDVVTALSARYGKPDISMGTQRYVRIPGQKGWFERADDPSSLSWQYEYTSLRCWGTLCLVFGGDDAETLQLRGWELTKNRTWAVSPSPGTPSTAEPTSPRSPDVRLAGSGIRLGSTWKQLHAAYPDTVGGGGEGASLVVKNTPWAGISDGVGAWRLSGGWDYTRPTHVPAGAKVIRLSAGEGPQPGCC